tara:strand:- start:110 stop:1513 length:1404 start_codon:yes stop_codon:yes gene_type:complete
VLRGVKVQVLSGLPLLKGLTMDIKEIKSKKLYKEYSLEIPYKEIDEKINEKIKNLLPTVTIQGFRKGKAPLAIVRKKYEDNILNEVLQNIVSQNTTNVIKEKNLKLFRQPKVDLKKFEKNQPVNIEIKLDLEPEIKLKNFNQIKLNKYEINLSKKIKDEQFNQFISSQKIFKIIEKNRSLKKSDRVIVNLETKDENIPEYLKSQKKLPIDTESQNEILPDLSKKLIEKKVKVGDSLILNFDLSKSLNDKKFNNIKFNIKIEGIEEKVKFELTKEFLEKNKFKDENQLRDFLNDNLNNQINQGLKQIEKKQLMDLLDKEYKFDLPEGVLEDDFNEIWQRIEHAKKEGTLDEDDKTLSDEKLKKRYKKISERRVKLAVLLQQIAKSQNLSVSEDEISKGIMQYASQYPGQEKQIIEYLKNNPSSLESIRGPMLEEKIIESIISKAKIKIKKISDEEYKKLEVETFNIKR